MAMRFVPSRFATAAAALSSLALSLISLSAAKPVAAQTINDTSFGSDARAFAMGGAGLAVIDTRANGMMRYNPAALAFETRAFQFYAPNIAIRADDIDANDIVSYLSSDNKANNARRLARESGGDSPTFGLNTNIGVRFQNWEIMATAVGKGRIEPNDSFKRWADAGGSLNVPDDVRADLIAAAYYTLPQVSYAFKLPSKPERKNDIAIGGRLKVIRATYTHYIVGADQLLNRQDAVFAPELRGDDYLEKTGIGMDLGIMVRPKNGGFNYALVINNLIQPNIKFDGTDSNGNDKEYDLFKFNASLGAAYQKGDLTIAADLTDFTGAERDPQLRFGAEQRFGRFFAGRAGYSTATGLTFGAGILGFDFAISERSALEVAKTISF